MTARILTVRKNTDGTVTVQSRGGAHKYIEHVDVRTLPPTQKFEKIKWAILTAGFAFTEDVEDMVRDELWR